MIHKMSCWQICSSLKLFLQVLLIYYNTMWWYEINIQKAYHFHQLLLLYK